MCTAKGVTGWLPVTASALATIPVFKMHGITMRIVLFVCTLLWLVSNALSLSIGGTVLEAIIAAVNLWTIIRTGAVGSAHAMKALNNFVYAAGLLATAEALRMGEALGLDLGILTDVMNASSGRNIATETKSRQEIISGRYAGGFMLGLMRKDLDTAGSIAEQTGFPASMLALCRERWAEAVAALGPKVDNTEIHRFIGAKR